jgi:hypothetical protein
MDWLIFLGTMLVLALIVAVVARIVASRIVAGGKTQDFATVLAAILLSFGVMLLAAQQALAVQWLFHKAGIDPATALAGKFVILAFVGGFVPIASYVLTFLAVVRKGKK